MRNRLTTAALLTAALVLAPAAGAVAAGPPAGGHGAEALTKAQARAAAHRLERVLGSHRSVVMGGTLVSATADDPAVVGDAGQVVLTVHGGRFKLLRKTDLTVVVDETAKVTRAGTATLADLVAGDHVVVRLTGVDLSVTKDTAGQWTLTGTATAKRVAASPADGEDTTEPTEPVESVEPVVPTA